MSDDDGVPNDDGVHLLGVSANPFSSRVKIALDEKGVEYECHELFMIPYRDKSELTPLTLFMLKSKPIYETVPVLLHNRKPVVGSTNIMIYIDETWPTPPFMPSSPYERSQARFWADYIDKMVFQAGARIWKGNGDEVEAGKKEFIGILKCLEGAMGDKDYFGGDTFGFVDISLIALTFWFVSFENYGKFKVEDHCPKITSWIHRCSQRRTVFLNLLDSHLVYDLVRNLRAVYEVDPELLDAWKLDNSS